MQIKINTLERHALTGGVQTAHWTAVETDEEYTASVYGSAGFSPNPDDESFVAFEDLTEAQVVAWVEEYLGEEQLAAMQANLLAQIENQKNPPVISGTPW